MRRHIWLSSGYKIRTSNTSHAHDINKCLNTKRKLTQCKANLYFNKSCLELNVTPKYTNIIIIIKSHKIQWQQTLQKNIGKASAKLILN